MSTRNSSTLTKKYKTALSAIHIISRLINSTTDIKELILRVARLTTQIVNVQTSQIIISEPNNKFLSIKVFSDSKKRSLVRRKKGISNPVERKIVLSGSLISDRLLLGIPLIGDNLVGGIIVKGKTDDARFINPIKVYRDTIGPTNTVFYEGDRYCGQENNLFFGDFNNKALRKIVLKSPEFNQVLSAGIVRTFKNPVIDVELGPDGFIYVSTTTKIVRIVQALGQPC